MKRADLISGAGISSSALSKMRKDKSVLPENIDKIGQFLKFDVEQVEEIK